MHTFILHFLHSIMGQLDKTNQISKNIRTLYYTITD